MFTRLAALTGFLLISVPALGDTVSCSSHSTQDGSYLSGRTYKTFDSVSAVTPAKAFPKVVGFLVNEGWQINIASKDGGVIQASHSLSAISSDPPAHINVLIEDEGAGSKLTVSVVTQPMQMASGSDKYVCDVIAAVSK